MIWPDQTDLLSLVATVAPMTKADRYSAVCAPGALGEKGDSMRARFILPIAQKHRNQRECCFRGTSTIGASGAQ
jgi:hypothetical protein